MARSAVSYEKLGDVLEGLGGMAAAIAHYEQSLPIAEALASADPSNPGLAEEVEITKQRIADLRAKAAGEP